jgi:hypothetical protein
MKYQLPVMEQRRRRDPQYGGPPLLNAHRLLILCWPRTRRHWPRKPQSLTLNGVRGFNVRI